MEMAANCLEIRCLEYLFLLIVLCSFHSLPFDGGDTLSLGIPLTGNQTIMSKNGMFEMGFFSPSGTHNWYVGIWYAQVSEKAIVWVANRQSPIRNIPGILKLSRDGHLGVFAKGGASVWSINGTNKVSRGVLLDSGNFVLLGADNRSESVWESFDHPTHTWLSGMKVGKRHKFISWKNSSDPAPGLFSALKDPSGVDQFVLMWNDSVQYWTTGVWNGLYFSQLREIPGTYSAIKFKFDVYLTFTVTPEGEKVNNHLVLEKDGGIAQYFFINGKRTMRGGVPADQCQVYGICGAYGTCNPNNVPFCSCVQGFQPTDNRSWNSQEWWSSGCVRRNPLQCSATDGSGTTDGFLQLRGTSLPEEQAVLCMEEKTLHGCRAACLNNCSCNAFVATATVCRFWFGDLLNFRHSSDGQSLFIRLAASDLPQPSSNRTKVHVVSIIVSVCTGFALAFALFTWLKRRRLQYRKGGQDEAEMFLRRFTYRELQIATTNFKHKLGSGGFASVFKGTLTDGALVAVKKLEGTPHCEKQFRAEISTVGNIQHVNLVRLRGFCAEQSLRLLVYDYMPNGSLNSFLFSNDKAGKEIIPLDWKTRFNIALGTARALLYLHEECRDRIIHCDIKPENILLDEHFCPKVADFGLAKSMGRDFSHVLTTMRGTIGYLAPEWISGMPITDKADVYSFGMTLLEIISGRRNLDLNAEESSRIVFPPWAVAQIEKGNIMGVVDPKIVGKAEVEELVRACVVVGLCIQEDENARPSMAQVVLMLQGQTQTDTAQVAGPVHQEVACKEGDDSKSDSDIFV